MLRKWMTLALAVAAVAVACAGDDDETASTSTSSSAAAGGEDDGLFRPDPSGASISETIACETLRAAFQAKSDELVCSKTIRICPDFLRVHYDPDCVQYDEGTVAGCEDYFNNLTSCDELISSNCVLKVYPGSEPQNCP